MTANGLNRRVPGAREWTSYQRLDQGPQRPRPARCRHARESGPGFDSDAAARHGSGLHSHRDPSGMGRLGNSSARPMKED